MNDQELAAPSDAAAPSPTPGPKAIKVGVVLAEPQELPGAWITSARAFDTARAHSLWIGPGPWSGSLSPEESRCDPLALAAALAAATARSLLVVAPSAEHAGLVRTLATVQALSSGRLAAAVPQEERSGGAAHPSLLADLDLPVFKATGSGAFERTLGNAEAEAGRELWVPVGGPRSRAEWRDTLLAAAESGASGVLVPAGPRLLDILRNPKQPGRRHDLQTAVG